MRCGRGDSALWGKGSALSKGAAPWDGRTAHQELPAVCVSANRAPAIPKQGSCWPENTRQSSGVCV